VIELLAHDVCDPLPFPDNWFHCVVTSPPYWMVRDYQVGGSPWPVVGYAPLPGLPHLEIPAMTCALGLEPTPESFIGHLVYVFREIRRVLRQDGTLWVNIGDCYANDAKGPRGTDKSTLADGGAYQNEAMPPRMQKGWRASKGIKRKDMIAAPWRLGLALQADGWYLRQDIIWQKSNPQPEPVRGRCTKAHEYILLLAKSARYFYDSEGIAEPAKPESVRRYGYAFTGRPDAPMPEGIGQRTSMTGHRVPSESRIKRSVWTFSTYSCKEAHFATFPRRWPSRAFVQAHRPGVLSPRAGLNGSEWWNAERSRCPAVRSRADGTPARAITTCSQAGTGPMED